MNLVKQRYDLKQCCYEKLLSDWQLEQALKCPVFMWQSGLHSMTPQEIEFLEQNVMDKNAVLGNYFPKHPPYPVFRIAYADIPVYEQWFIGEGSALCIRSDCIRSDCGFSMPGKSLHTLHHYTSTSSKVKLVGVVDGKKITPEGNTWTAGNMRVTLTQDEIREFISAPLNWLAFFLLDVMTPSNVIVKVTPEAKGRSVEWVQAREHYLILNRKKAATIRERKTGPTEHELKRAAHWRIAHFRRLVSEKFTHKKGLLIPVKQAWVGPKEWVGADGKIYKVQST